MCVFLRTPKARTKSLCSRKLRLARRRVAPWSTESYMPECLHPNVGSKDTAAPYPGRRKHVPDSASSKETALPLLEMDEPRGGTVPRGGCGDQGETWEVSGP